MTPEPILDPALLPPPRRSRGRPCKVSAERVLTIDEVAFVLGTEPELLQRALEVSAPSFFQGATKDASGVWSLPASALKPWLLQPNLLGLLRIEHCCKILKKPRDKVLRWIERGLLPAVKLPDDTLRVRPSELIKVARPAASFFGGVKS